MKNGRIAGTGSYVPETIWKNEDLEKMVETSDAWIRERTGIGARHIAGEETVAQMAVKAARRALENAGICSTELDLILVGTSSSESIFPNTACLVQDEIGAFRAACLDVSAACTGFLAVYELGQLYIRSGKAKNVLLIGADALSRLVDWHDRGTCILFGDGGGSHLCVTAEEQETKACEKIHSDGEKGVSLTCERERICRWTAVPCSSLLYHACRKSSARCSRKPTWRSKRLMRLSFIRQTAASSTAWQND